MRSEEIFIKIFLNFDCRVGDNSAESWAVVITVGVVAVISITALSFALVTLIRTKVEDNKSRMMTSSTDSNML